MPDKFGLPRQSGLSGSFLSRIVMEKPYRAREAFRGLELYDHLWLLWEFEHEEGAPFSPTVRPPRLGGNERLGVFATRSPNRPNHIGMTVVELKSLEMTGEGPVLTVAGADMKSGTAIFDIKPYLPYADSWPEARCDREARTVREGLAVVWERPEDRSVFPGERADALEELLALDPRPGYQHDEARVYKMSYAGHQIHFIVRAGQVRIRGVIKDGLDI